jgi:hypothetical protein
LASRVSAWRKTCEPELSRQSHNLRSFGRERTETKEIGAAYGLHRRRGMDPAEFDRLVVRARNPRLIPGIYNYCDGRCPRCPFTNRCLTYLDGQELDVASGTGLHGSLASRVGALLKRTLDMLAEAGRRAEIDLSARDEDDADGEKIQAALARHHDDPLVARSREYAHLAWPIVKALMPVVVARGDPAMVDAVETIEWFSTLVSSKIFRAVAGQAELSWRREGDEQTDHDGSAKVALIGIAESRDAWRRLMEKGKATADGVPARAVHMLDALESDLRARFPGANAFVRPGFDEPEIAAGAPATLPPYAKRPPTGT